MSGRTRHVTIPAPLLATLCGSLAGLLTFAASAALWRTGRAAVADVAAEAVLVAALALVSLVVLVAEPAWRRRARVPAGRALPPAWWTAPHDPLPALAVCAGAPVAMGAAAAVLLFR